MVPANSLIIFSDLDGTLLDHQTYAFAPASEALEVIRASGTPLVFCSSKTRTEIEVWRKRLNNPYPFITENGGAVFFPPDSPFPKTAKTKNDYFVVELGIPYVDLRAGFLQLKALFGEAIRGFSEMSVREVGERTGLQDEDALRAAEREYTEPFVFYGKKTDMRRLQHAVAELNLNITRGGRFHHLLASNDKGKAVRLTAEAYRVEKPDLITVALGDSANDFPMLQVVDIPILVQNPGGTYDPTSANLPEVRKASGIGPTGWNQAVLEVFGEI